MQKTCTSIIWLFSLNEIIPIYLKMILAACLTVEAGCIRYKLKVEKYCIQYGRSTPHCTYWKTNRWILWHFPIALQNTLNSECMHVHVHVWYVQTGIWFVYTEEVHIDIRCLIRLFPTNSWISLQCKFPSYIKPNTQTIPITTTFICNNYVHTFMQFKATNFSTNTWTHYVISYVMNIILHK